MKGSVPRIAISAGEPAGIGPELVLGLAAREWPADLLVYADPDLLAARARQTGQSVRLETADGHSGRPAGAGCLRVRPVPLDAPSVAGKPDPRNARAVLRALDLACDDCLDRRADALLTAPLHKGVINDAGIAFTGHTEYLAARSGAPRPVMLLVAGGLRVALQTTHLPLSAVPAAITRDGVEATLAVLDDGLRRRFGIARPRVVVLGLNPHAGEGGHMGREEIERIAPAVEAMRARGMDVRGPLPADTAFVEQHLAGTDAVLAMYHDQGLPVLKHRGFGHAVNVTLGLPIIRTSVDHGTALDIAGTGRADAGSLIAALSLAVEMAGRTGGGPAGR